MPQPRKFSSDYPDKADATLPYELVKPHSTWQVELNKAREKADSSWGDVAKRAKIPAVTLHRWVHYQQPAPERERYSKIINNRLAKALKIDRDKLWGLYQACVAKRVKRKKGPKWEKLEMVRGTVVNSPVETYTREQVIQILDSLK